MPWVQTLVMIATSPIAWGLASWVITGVLRWMQEPPLDPEDPRWPRF